MADTIEALRRKLEAATRGPWQWSTDGGIVDVTSADGSCIAEDLRSEPNAALIVSAINALPALLAVAEAAERYQKALEKVDFEAGVYAYMGSGPESKPVRDEAWAASDALDRALASLTRNDEASR